jgi:hypothetical protein
VPVTEPEGWRFKRGKHVLPVILMAVENARIAAAWGDLTPPENLLRSLGMTIED